MTTLSDFTFKPQIAQDHVAGYWRKLLLLGKLAVRPDSKKFKGVPGNQITFPFFETIGAAEDLTEATAMSVDSLGDNRFTATIKEIGKAVSLTDTARYGMGCTQQEWEEEAHRQIARVLAEKVEIDLWAEIDKSANHLALNSPSTDFRLTTAFGGDKARDSAALALQLYSVRALASDLTEAFGDRRAECMAIILHSQMYNDIENDATAGFLKADANDPMYKLMGPKSNGGKGGGFVGRAMGLFGIPVFVNDQVTAGADITVTDSASATQKYATYNAYYFKRNAFGLFAKQDPKIEYDRDILKRVDTMAATQWYALRGFHKAISDDDIRIARKRYTVRKQVA